MYLKKLQLLNFKNHSELSLELSSGVTCFTGSNGIGKSNILDAIHLLALCKSSLNPIDSQLIKDGTPFFVVEGFFESEGKEEHIFVGLKPNQKKQFKRNKKAYKRLADHIGRIPLVMISPYESEMISGGSESRRKFMDGVLAQVDEVYLDNLMLYNKVLKNRNAYLKAASKAQKIDQDMLDTYNEQLAGYGTLIFKKRLEFIDWFTPIFERHYHEISGGMEQVQLVYESQLLKEEFIPGTEQRQQKDFILQRSTFGIHKDDLNFLISGKSLKKFGSQGQQKSFLLAVKLAEYAYIKNHKKLDPILLLDDILDKLDSDRVTALLSRVASKEFGQVFVTDTSSSRLREIFEKIPLQASIFELDKKGVKKINEG